MKVLGLILKVCVGCGKFGWIILPGPVVVGVGPPCLGKSRGFRGSGFVVVGWGWFWEFWGRVGVGFVDDVWLGGWVEVVGGITGAC